MTYTTGYDRRDYAVSDQQRIDDQRTALRDEIHDQILSLSKTVAKLDDLDDTASDIPTVDELLSFVRVDPDCNVGKSRVHGLLSACKALRMAHTTKTRVNWDELEAMRSIDEAVAVLERTVT